MFILFCTVILFVLVVAAGGRLSRLGTLRLREVWLLFAALALQLLITEVMPSSAPGWLDASLHVLSYVLAGAFLWRNHRIPGLLLLGTGAAANGVDIALNGGELPASARALRAAHIHQAAGAFANSGRLAHPVLPWLGDIVATPSWLPFQNVLSVGDVLILAGAAWLLVGTCGTRWSAAAAAVAPTRDPAADPAAEAGAAAAGSTRGRHRAGAQRGGVGASTPGRRSPGDTDPHAGVEGESCVPAPLAARGVSSAEFSSVVGADLDVKVGADLDVKVGADLGVAHLANGAGSMVGSAREGVVRAPVEYLPSHEHILPTLESVFLPQ